MGLLEHRLDEGWGCDGAGAEVPVVAPVGAAAVLGPDPARAAGEAGSPRGGAGSGNRGAVVPAGWRGDEQRTPPARPSPAEPGRAGRDRLPESGRSRVTGDRAGDQQTSLDGVAGA